MAQSICEPKLPATGADKCVLTNVSKDDATTNDVAEINVSVHSASTCTETIPGETSKLIARTQQNVDIVGGKPLLNFRMNSKPCVGLWDTGSMVCLVNANWLKRELPDVDILGLHEVSQGVKHISLTAANGGEIVLKGVAMLNFSLSGCDSSWQVPFLVSTQKLPHPIIGYNLIQHIVKEGGIRPEVLKSAIPSLSDPVAMINTIEEEGKFYNVIATDTVVVPANNIVMVDCKIAGKLRFGCPVIFQPNLLLDPSLSCPEFVSNEELLCLKIPVMNKSDSDVTLDKLSILGSVEAVGEIVEFETGKLSERTTVVSSVQSLAEVESDGWLPNVNLSHLPSAQRKLVERLLLKHNRCFARDPLDLGAMESLQLKINLHDHVPVHKSYRKIPPQLYTEVKEFLDSLLLNGFIQKSESPYASPIVCARKSCGSLRSCVDYRKLNSKTIPDRMPIPRISDVIESLSGKRWFSTLDMTKAYHQGFIEEESRKYTAFSTPWTLYEWVRIPYGLTNAPPVFQRKINDIFEDLLYKICTVYLDDVLTFSDSFSAHLEDLDTILTRIESQGIKLNPTKCHLFKNSVKYLGKIISCDGYHDDPTKTEVVERLLKSPPTTVKELRKLLGFLGYYRSSIPNFARITKPLYDMLKKQSDKDTPRKPKELINWRPEHQLIVHELSSTWYLLK